MSMDKREKNAIGVPPPEMNSKYQTSLFGNQNASDGFQIPNEEVFGVGDIPRLRNAFWQRKFFGWTLKDRFSRGGRVSGILQI